MAIPKMPSIKKTMARNRKSKTPPTMKAMKAMAASSGSPSMKPMQGMMPNPMMGMKKGGSAKKPKTGVAIMIAIGKPKKGGMK